MGSDPNGSAVDPSATVRIDIWLDIACLFRTRSEAQRACKGGKVDVNGQSAKPHRPIHLGDELLITRPFGRKQRVLVRAIPTRHVPKADARQLYEDITPTPSAAELEIRRLERVYRAALTPPRAPDKRQRRYLRQLKERQ